MELVSECSLRKKKQNKQANQTNDGGKKGNKMTKKITSAMEVLGRFLGEKFPRADALASLG